MATSQEMDTPTQNHNDSSAPETPKSPGAVRVVRSVANRPFQVLPGSFSFMKKHHLFLAFVSVGLSATPIVRADAPPIDTTPPTPVPYLSPEAEAKTFVLPEGYRLELVLSEPEDLPTRPMKPYFFAEGLKQCARLFRESLLTKVDLGIPWRRRPGTVPLSPPTDRQPAGGAWRCAGSRSLRESLGAAPCFGWALARACEGRQSVRGDHPLRDRGRIRGP